MLMLAVLLLAALSGLSFVLAKGKAQAYARRKYARLPTYYGYCAMLWVFAPFLLTLFAFGPTKPEGLIAAVIAGLIAIGAMLYFFSPRFKAQKHFEHWIRGFLMLAAAISICITLFIIASVLFESIRFFKLIPITEFLFGTHWSPQTALRADQAGSSGSFGAIPVFLGTLLITAIALIVAAPIGLMSAIYLSEYARPKTRARLKPALEILAGIPTVVYGYFAAIIFGPALKSFFSSIGFDIAAENALTAGIVMGIMIVPFVMSLSDDVMNAVPRSLKEAAIGLGATKSEAITSVTVPAALPGIMGALLLAVSRGIGETMIVVMAAGLSANLTLNPFESVTTVTAQMVTLLVGDQEFDSAKTLAAFALGLTLFIMTLALNIAAMIIVKKYRERYE